MQTYLTLVSVVSLVGFYAALVILSRAIPAFALGVDDGPAIRGTLATALGIATTMFPLWRLHWISLRRLWAARNESGREYLFIVSSLGVVATAITAGRLVTHITALLLDTAPATNAGGADMLSALLLFTASGLLWHHHWALLRHEVASSEPVVRPRPAASTVPLLDRPAQRQQRAA
jgi:hypothetical protein